MTRYSLENPDSRSRLVFVLPSHKVGGFLSAKPSLSDASAKLVLVEHISYKRARYSADKRAQDIRDMSWGNTFQMFDDPDFWLTVFDAVQRHEGTLTSICMRFGLSRQTYYVYRRRFEADGIEGLSKRSTRPHTMPARIADELEERIVQVRMQSPWLGARAIRSELVRSGVEPVPAVSTIARVLRRRGFVNIEFAEPICEDDDSALPGDWA